MYIFYICYKNLSKGIMLYLFCIIYSLQSQRFCIKKVLKSIITMNCIFLYNTFKLI